MKNRQRLVATTHGMFTNSFSGRRRLRIATCSREACQGQVVHGGARLADTRLTNDVWNPVQQCITTVTVRTKISEHTKQNAAQQKHGKPTLRTKGFLRTVGFCAHGRFLCSQMVPCAPTFWRVRYLVRTTSLVQTGLRTNSIAADGLI